MRCTHIHGQCDQYRDSFRHRTRPFCPTHAKYFWDQIEWVATSLLVVCTLVRDSHCIKMPSTLWMVMGIMVLFTVCQTDAEKTQECLGVTTCSDALFKTYSCTCYGPPVARYCRCYDDGGFTADGYAFIIGLCGGFVLVMLVAAWWMGWCDICGCCRKTPRSTFVQIPVAVSTNGSPGVQLSSPSVVYVPATVVT